MVTSGISACGVAVFRTRVEALLVLFFLVGETLAFGIGQKYYDDTLVYHISNVKNDFQMGIT